MLSYVFLIAIIDTRRYK